MMRIRALGMAHTQACSRALAQMRAHPASTLLSIFVIGVAMTLPLLFQSLYTSLSLAAGRVNTEPHISVYLAVGATTDEARAAEAKLRSLSNVQSVVFVSREAALVDLKTAARLGDLLAGVEGNPLPHAFVVTPKSFEPDAMAETRKAIQTIKRVELIHMEFEWARKLTRFANFLRDVGAALALLLAVAVVFVTGNTIRLQILTKRDEIVVSRLIGATKRFVRRPFLYFGALQGLLAASIALILVSLFTLWASAEVQAVAASYGARFEIAMPSANLTLVALGLGLMLGWLGAVVTVALYWREYAD